jgi:hypothetical protein
MTESNHMQTMIAHMCRLCSRRNHCAGRYSSITDKECRDIFQSYVGFPTVDTSGEDY